jgi:hypothetical protein
MPVVSLRRVSLAFVLLAYAGACGGSASPTLPGAPPPPPDGTAGAEGASGPAPSSSSGTASSTSSSSSSTGGAPTPTPTPSAADGTASRVACTATLGPGLTTTHGRLDGYLRAIVAPKESACHADGTHVHLQVEASGATFDIAVNIDALEAETTVTTLPGGPWAEGWRASVDLDYATDLALHASAFTTTGLSTVRSRVTDALAAANHVTIFATGYGPDGAHLVHREGGGRDGAVVIDPLGPAPRLLAFRFDRDVF